MDRTQSSLGPSEDVRVDKEANRANDQNDLARAEEATLEGDTQPITGIKWIMICVSLFVSILLYGLDTTIAADVQSAVTQTFDSVDQVAWLGAGFVLGSTATILLWGALFNQFNMKWLFVSGMILFQAGSALCGGAPSMEALIVGRVTTGVGGGGVYLGALNYFASPLVSDKHRGAYLAAVSFNWGIGCVLGPVVGGSFSDSSATWRWAFYINLCIFAVVGPVYLFALPSIHPTKGVSIKGRLFKLDLVGFLLSAGAWVTFTVVLLSAGLQWAWDSNSTIAVFVVFGFLALAYLAQQYFCIFTSPSTRSFPAHLLLSRTQVLAGISNACSTTSLFVPIYYIPIYFQFVQDDDALDAAVRLLPLVLLCAASNLASGFLLPRIQYYKFVFMFSGICVTLAAALFYVYLNPSTPSSTIYGISIVSGFGTGLTLQAGYTVASLKVPADTVVSAINLENFAQCASVTCALVIGGQVFQSSAVGSLTAILGPLGYTSEQITSIVAGSQSVYFQELTGDVRDEALLAITGAIQDTFILVIAAGALLSVSGALMKMERLL